MTKNILVTGATGFIGQHLVRALLEKNYKVRIFTRDKNKAKKIFPQAEIVEGSINDKDAINRALKTINIVYHLAAIRHQWGISKKDYQKVNDDFTETLLQYSANHKIEKFIFASSVAVFGWPGKNIINEKNKYKYENSYGFSKILSESLIKKYFNKRGLKYVIIRPSITYGPNDPAGMITKLTKMIKNKKYFTVGNGKNKVQLCYIDDLIQGFILAMENPEAINNDFIITSTKPISINDLVQIICQELKINKPKLKIPKIIAYIAAFILETIIYKIFKIKITGKEPIITKEKINVMTANRAYNIEKAMKVLGYLPKHDYVSGIKKTIDWNKQHNLI